MVDLRSFKRTSRSGIRDQSLDHLFPDQSDPEAILTARGRRHANEDKVKKSARKEKKKEKQPRKIDLYRECKICAEEKRGILFPKRPLCPSTCSSVCKPCYQSYITEKFLTSTGKVDWSDLTCLECHLPLHPLTNVVDIPQDPAAAAVDATDLPVPTTTTTTTNTLTSILPKTFFTRPNKILAFRANQSHPAFRFCPSPTCSWGQLAPPNSPEVHCAECGFHYCATHLMAWHTGYSCARYEDSHPGAAVKQSSEDRIRKVGKQCPGVGCGWVVEKDGGCNHMSCARCGLNWGWDDVKFLGEAESAATDRGDRGKGGDGGRRQGDQQQQQQAEEVVAAPAAAAEDEAEAQQRPR